MSDMSRNIEGKEAEEILDSFLADYELDRTIDKMDMSYNLTFIIPPIYVNF